MARLKKFNLITPALKKMTIQEYKKQYLELEKKFSLEKEDFISKVFYNSLDRIKFLESIYLTGGKNNGYSERFKDQAYAERLEMSKKSSACHSILQDRKEAEKC